MDRLVILDNILHKYDIVLFWEYPNRYRAELYYENGQLAECHADNLSDLIAKLDEAGVALART